MSPALLSFLHLIAESATVFGGAETEVEKVGGESMVEPRDAELEAVMLSSIFYNCAVNEVIGMACFAPCQLRQLGDPSI